MAEDIEEIKKKLDVKNGSDKDEALKRLAVKLEPVIRFFGGNAPENISGIFGSKEAIEKSKKSLCDGVITSLEVFTDLSLIHIWMCIRDRDDADSGTKPSVAVN